LVDLWNFDRQRLHYLYQFHHPGFVQHHALSEIEIQVTIPILILKNTISFFRHKPSVSIGFIFSMGSLLLGIWVAALPGIKLRLGFTDGTLGLSLLLAPAGSLTGVLISSAFFSRVKAGKWLLIGPILQTLIFILQVMAPTPLIFWLALYGSGVVGFLNGVCANAMVDRMEKQYGKRMMSTCHGMYSLGGGISAGLAAIFYALHWTPVTQIITVALVAITILLSIRSFLLMHNVFIHSDAAISAPPLSIIGLAFICFVTFMGEGCIADWSAIYLRESLKSSIAIASIGYAGFSLMMAFGRFNGDSIIPKFGARRLVVTGSILACLGFCLVVFLPFQWAAISGFALIGLGFSCIVPILFSTAANVPGVSPAIGISAVASGGLIGFLAGPALIGLIAERVNLASGLGFVLILILFSTWVATRNKFLASDTNAKFIELT
jgi:predicted MFS family arabinose efflux permease